jgi:uncharacterized membrane protein
MFDRRTVLKATGIAACGGVGTASMAQQSVAQSSGDVLFDQDFSDVGVGSVPDNFVLAGNESQAVTDTTAAVGETSYQMDGSYGGCWEAITRASMDVADVMTVRGHFRLGDGEIGCHEKKIGTIGLRTTATGSWGSGSGVRLLNFAPNGTIKSQGQEVGTYGENEWIEFELEYIRDRENGTVTYNCQIDNETVQTLTRDERDHESELSALILNSGDFTVYWDDIQVRAGVESDEPAVFDLSVDSVTPESVDPGATATIDVTVTNTGETADDHPIDINLDGERLDRREVDLAPGDETTVEFTVTAPGTAGTYSYEIEADQTSTTASLDVGESASESTFDLSIDAVTPETVDPGSSALVDVTVTNTGSTSIMQSVDISLAGEQFDSQETTLDPGDTTDLTFSVDVPDTEGSYQIEVSSGDGSTTAELMVGEPAESLFEIDALYPESIRAAPREEVPVTTTVTNTGDAEQSETVSVLLDGSVVREVELSLEASETTETDIWVTVPDTAGDYEYEVTAGDSSQTWTAIVERADSDLSIETIDVPDQIRERESFEISLEIRNDDVDERNELMTITAIEANSETVVFDDTVELAASSRTTITETVDAPSVDDPVAVVFGVSVGGQTAQTDERYIEPQEQPDTGGSGSGSSDGGSSDGGSDDSVEVTVPGFTLPGTVASLGGAAYLLRKRLGDDES